MVAVLEIHHRRVSALRRRWYCQATWLAGSPGEHKLDLEQAIMHEREACVLIADAAVRELDKNDRSVTERIAEDIRARSRQ